ncbi:Leucine-rich repeat and fibronectin type-III domain-containing protein 5 [Geodia barretti]|uniref:Leucine-rich repeat and fibronectin type-III domain-containing protein 5 n=1 Tax=Geodia barretti TaxID=519541 RepID=A0AA35TF67_GEOBA|nr:Leucine-rich repeat and fibronectin type-III domain-containing protein 5 [Geodia barretti]
MVQDELLCRLSYIMAKVGVFFYYAFNPPLIMGETTIIKGSPLHLLCDGSNSDPQPTLQWISPDGKMVSQSGELDIVTTTRSMTGIYTCVATLPHSTATMNSTVNITIVSIDCPTLNSTDTMIVNMSSTAVGSTATYQCRDGPTDVYTTQCTSTGVWDPSPDCTSKEAESLFERYSKWLPWGAGAVGLLLLCCITTCAVITAVCVCKRSRRKGKQYLLRENSNHSDQQQQMAVKNSQYLPVVKKTSEGTTATTTLNGWSFVIESQLTTPAEPNGKPSEPQPTTTPPIPLGQYSMITTIPEPTSEVFGSYSDSQDELKQSPVPQPPEVPQETRKPNGQQQYSIVPEHTTGLIGAYCVVQTVEENPTPEPSRTVAQKPPQGNQQKGLLYVEVSLNTEGGGFGLVADRVEYAALDLNAMASQQPPPPQTPPPNSKVSLDQILIQLREVTPHWRRLGEAVGVQRLDEISEYVGSESEAMVEVVDGWLANLHPNKPTWREIADVVDSIGHHDLAHSLRQVYVSGSLPIKVSNDLPESLVVREFNPTPPLPPRGADDEQLPSPLPARTLI